jgi:glycosyltransferase involved in cell wall biosynthesis
MGAGRVNGVAEENPWPTAGRRILVGCFEVPGYGGGSTATYSLYRRMRRDGRSARLVNLVVETQLSSLQSSYGAALGNPESLAGVETRTVSRWWTQPDQALTDRIEELDPDLLLGVGYIAADILKRSAGTRPLVFLTSGCRQAKTYIDRGVRDALALERLLQRPGPWPMEDRDEPRAVANADLVVAHSELTLAQLHGFYPRWIGKIHPSVVSCAEWVLDDARPFAGLVRPFAERDIDVLFVANDWRRPEKNWPIVRALAQRLEKLEVHVAGSGAEPLPGVHLQGLVTDREQLFALMGNARTVVSPSLIDAAPHVLFEAAAMGCNLVASKNAGNWRICHPELLVDPPSSRTYASRIKLSLRQPFENGLETFLEPSAYAELMEILHVF